MLKKKLKNNLLKKLKTIKNQNQKNKIKEKLIQLLVKKQLKSQNQKKKKQLIKKSQKIKSKKTKKVFQPLNALRPLLKLNLMNPKSKMKTNITNISY